MEVLLNIKRHIKDRIKRQLDHVLVKRMKRVEVKKYKDSRRVNIYNKINLTSEQKLKIDKFYVEHYGEKVPYIWHQHFTAFTGKFDEKYVPELVYIPEFEHYMNYNKAFVGAIADKNLLPLIANAAGVVMPSTVISNTNDILRDVNNDIVDKPDADRILNSRKDIYFAKPSVDSDSGKGCMLIDNNEKEIKISDIIDTLGSDFVIQENISCSESITLLNSFSVNTFRIMTYFLDGKVCVAPAIMRIGRNRSFLDNAHAGGMFIAISNEGILHEKAFTEFKEEFTEHPDTHVVFKDYKINNFDKVLDCAKKMHMMIPQLGVVNWDFTINQNEVPVLIEANTIGGSIWLFEMAWGCGCFGENTEKVLRFIRNKKSETDRIRLL